MQKLNVYFWINVAVLGLCALPLPVQAASFDGSQNLLCAPQLVLECAQESKCEPVMAANINLPSFFQIDFSAMALTAVTEPESKRKSKIKSMESLDGKLFLQGADDGIEGVRDGLAWSMAISQESGRLVVSASGENEAFVIFGACTPR